MAGKGPVPKRSIERRRRNTKPGAGSVPPVPVDAPVRPENVEAAALAFFDAAEASGQAQFYEPSDWSLLLLLTTAVDRFYRAEDLDSAALAQIRLLSEQLLITEAARRRAGIEIERPSESADDPKVTAIKGYRERLSI